MKRILAILTAVLVIVFVLFPFWGRLMAQEPAVSQQCIFPYQMSLYVINLRRAPSYDSYAIGETLAMGEWLELDISSEPVPSGEDWDWLPAKWGTGAIWVSGQLVYVGDCPEIGGRDGVLLEASLVRPSVTAHFLTR